MNYRSMLNSGQPAYELVIVCMRYYRKNTFTYKLFDKTRQW